MVDDLSLVAPRITWKLPLGMFMGSWVLPGWGLLFNRERVSVYRPGYPETCYVDQASLELRDQFASVS